MVKRIMYLLVLSLCLVLSASLAFSYSGAKATALKAAAVPTIDGKVSDGEWGDGIYLSKAVCLKGQAKYNGFGNVYQPDMIKDENDISGTIYCLWDEKNLYLAGKITDDDIYLEKGSGWDNDCNEIRFSPDGKAVIGLWITPKLLNKNPGWYHKNDTNAFESTEESTLIKSTVTAAKGYEWEAAIPIADKTIAGVNPAAGRTVGYTVSIGDQDKGGAEYSMPCWSLNPDKWDWGIAFWGEVTFSAVTLSKPSAVSPNAKLTSSWGDIKTR
ncbi:MAG: sugar-binding protein [Candidatus Poribacteria bacterium]